MPSYEAIPTEVLRERGKTWAVGFKKMPKLRHMMATKALHLLGDISRKTEDLIIVDRHSDEHWMGNWVFGYGMINVKFPKFTTRDLTAEEIKHYETQHLELAGMDLGLIHIQR